MLYSLPSKWLMQKYPALMTDSGGPDSKSYAGLFDPYEEDFGRRDRTGRH